MNCQRSLIFSKCPNHVKCSKKQGKVLSCYPNKVIQQLPKTKEVEILLEKEDFSPVIKYDFILKLFKHHY